MKKLLAILFLISVSYILPAQQQDPVKWSAKYQSISATEGEIIIFAAIENGWHIYSQDTTSAGPIPTSFKFNSNNQYTLLGKTSEIGAHQTFDKAFEATISAFSTKGEFRQKIKLNAKKGFSTSIIAEYMSCNDMMCLPPKTIELSVKVQ